MTVGDCESEFAAAAARVGIVLVRARVSWLNQRGHFGLPEEAEAARPVLAEVFKALGGDPLAQGSKRLTSLPGDFCMRPVARSLRSMNFSTSPVRASSRWSCTPSATALGFDPAEYRSLIQKLVPRADRYLASKPAVAFGAGGRQRQRAYYDALRDIATPAMGYPPVIRVPAVEGNGETALRAGPAPAPSDGESQQLILRRHLNSSWGRSRQRLLHARPRNKMGCCQVSKPSWWAWWRPWNHTPVSRDRRNWPMNPIGMMVTSTRQERPFVSGCSRFPASWRSRYQPR